CLYTALIRIRMSARNVTETAERRETRMGWNNDARGAPASYSRVERRGHFRRGLADGDNPKALVRGEIVEILSDGQHVALAMNPRGHARGKIKAPQRLAEYGNELRLHGPLIPARQKRVRQSRVHHEGQHPCSTDSEGSFLPAR